MDDFSKMIFEKKTQANKDFTKNNNLKSIQSNSFVYEVYSKFKNSCHSEIKMKRNIINIYDNKNIEKKNLKNRNPGIDLVRLICMFMIIINHFLYFGQAFKKYPNHKNVLIPLHNLTDWSNNGFALISGIVGYKTNRYSNLLYLWVTVFFYSLGIHLFIRHFKKDFIIKHKISVEFFPIIFKRYWYFTAYFGMYLYLPVINKGISYLTKSEFKLVVMSTLGIFVLWRDYKNPNRDVFDLREGNSMIWLLTYYLTGAYIGKYNTNYTGYKKYFFYFLCLFIYFFPSYLYNILNNNQQNESKSYLKKKLKQMLTKRYDSFFKISQSISACLFFMQIKYSNFASKIICFLGPLAFGIYLIHTHPIFIVNSLKHIFDNLRDDISINSIIFLVLLKTLKVFIFCIIIDYFRSILFSFLKLRKIFITVEEKMKNILNENDNLKP